MKEFFPEIEPYKTHRLKVSDIHELYIEEAGNPSGQPVVFLHGGPGAGLSDKYRRFFDPNHYRVILFDQRGSGKSTPHASLEKNTTWDLVEDIEKIRKFFSISRWLVFGGSWGSTLGLAYAEAHPQVVTGLILRGIFLCRPEEIDWFYQEGCDLIFPDLWEEFVSVIPPEERHEMIAAYYRRLTSPDPAISVPAARAWSMWEGSTVHLLPNKETLDEFEEEHMAVSLARIECHYFINNCWFTEEDQLVRNAHKLRHIPAVIVHGRYDVVCPVKNAWDLHKAWPEADLKIIPDAGHAADEPGNLNALIEATEKFKGLK
jgi:proline iminopeptidase